jgi:hypothetical protein
LILIDSIEMPNKARDQVRRELELIRKLSEDDNLSDNEILEQLKISQPTLDRYKRRIRQQYIKAWEKQDSNRAEYTYAKFQATLDYCYRETKKIIDSDKSKPMERIEAIKTLDVLASQIATLAKDGPIFKPQLPKVLEIDAKEVTV